LKGKGNAKGNIALRKGKEKSLYISPFEKKILRRGKRGKEACSSKKAHATQRGEKGGSHPGQRQKEKTSQIVTLWEKGERE